MGEQGVSTLNEENRWYVRLMKLAHDLAIERMRARWEPIDQHKVV